MTEQREHLRSVKESLKARTWDDLAELAGVSPRALKTYRMPSSSSEYRRMPGAVHKVFEMLLAVETKKKVTKR